MDNLLAAFIFLTRLPFWKIKEVPARCFKHVVPYWPWVGWLTGGLMAATVWLGSRIWPVEVAWLMAVVVRLLVTGGLHEDGLADFFDGFGGGRGRSHTLAIMKDSHIGSYGVIALVVYFLLLFQLCRLPVPLLCTVLFCGDCWSKFCASQIVNVLPYARSEEESKAKVVYNRMSGLEWLAGCIGGCVPLLWLLPAVSWVAVLPAVVVCVCLLLLMRHRLQGYTGDCCGALFLLCELTFYLSCLALWK